MVQEAPRYSLKDVLTSKARNFAVPVVAALALAACTSVAQSRAPQPASTLLPTTETTRATTQPSVTAEPPLSSTSLAPAANESGLEGCRPYFDFSKYHNHEYEVCVAYISNAAEIALQGLYKFGNNTASYVSDAAQHHFETRYWNQPRQMFEQQIHTWPKTDSLAGNSVEEAITVTSLSSNLAADRGVLETEESWQVTSPTGTVLLNQPNETQGVTMCRGRLPGHLLHEWVVVTLTAQPAYDCLSFNAAHGIHS